MELMKKQIKRFLFILGNVYYFLFKSVLAVAKGPDYPTKLITFYIIFSIGGTTDLTNGAFIKEGRKLTRPPASN
jgi:tripartite-type tricarboxylate transporter receptor subunit TctC